MGRNLRLDAVCTHATVSMGTYKQRQWQFRLDSYIVSAGCSSKFIIEGSPCRPTVMYAVTTLVELAIPSTVAAGPVG